MKSKQNEIQKIVEIVSNPDLHNRISLALRFQLPLRNILKEIKESISNKFVIGISILDSFGKTIESTGNMIGDYTNIISFGEENTFHLGYSISEFKEEHKLDILVMGESRSGKTSLVHRLNYNDFLPIKLHSVGLSDHSLYFGSTKLNIMEIGGNIDLLTYFAQTKKINTYDLIFFLIDNSFVFHEQNYYQIFQFISKIHKNNDNVYIVKTKTDQKTSEKNYKRIKQLLLEQEIIESTNLIKYSALDNSNFQELISIIFESIKRKKKKRNE